MVRFAAVGCGCLGLLALVAAVVTFFVYASTDPGPPVETAAVMAVGTIGLIRALGVLGGFRTAS
jgi:hypothetical protein